MVLSLFALLSAFGLLTIVAPFDSNGSLVREARCQAGCLSKFGYSQNHTLRSSDTIRVYRCVEDCEDCWTGCTFGLTDCHLKCRRMKNSSTCIYGCDWSEQLQSFISLANGTDEIDSAINDEISPAGALSFVCMNAVATEPSSVLGSFVVKWNVEPITSHLFLYEARYKLYSMEMQNYTDSDWFTLGTRAARSVALRNMFPSTQYQVRALAIDSNGLLAPAPFYSPWIETLSEEAIVKPPLSVQDVSQKPSKNSQGCMQAVIAWIPDPSYPSCFYRLVWSDGDNIESRAFAIDDGFRYAIDKLKYDTEYTVMIRAIRDPKPTSPESSPVVTTFTTWSCLEANRFDFQVCAPGAVRSLLIEVYGNATAIVQWTPPAYVSVVNTFSHYLVRFRSLVHVGRCLKHVKDLIRLSPDQSSLTIPSLENNCYYIVGVTAVSEGGVGPETLAEFNFTLPDDPYYIMDRINVTVTVMEKGYEQLYALLLIPLAILLTLAIVILYFKLRPRKVVNDKPIIDPHHIALKRVLERNLTYRCPGSLSAVQHSLLTAVTNDLGPYLKLMDQIGRGEFGCVYSAVCHRPGLPKMVAVKTLKIGDTNPSAERILDLEIELMQRITEPHQNVVKSFGVCTLTIAGCARKGLVMEYCAQGNLKEYLKKTRQEHMRQLQRANLSPTDSGYGALEFPWTINAQSDDVAAITSDLELRQLLLYAWQVCCGMEHLCQHQLVHRDLAARNILVAEGGQVVKVSDFGLCRVGDILGEYRLTSGQQPRLPVRWMAPEAIRTCVFSSQSDVWSFGIFLWELVTIGDDPYPGYTCDQIPGLLKSGYRMPKPDCCDQETYDMMLQCWKDAPNDRPTFTELRCQLEKMLENSNQHNYIHVVDA